VRSGLLLKYPATVLAAVVAARTAAVAQNPTQTYDAASVVQAVCRQYAASQHALPYETMYAQCMYARGYVAPGFSTSPDSPGYQGPLPGPFTHGGGGP
jgi:Flp pilus assembly protein TadG